MTRSCPYPSKTREPSEPSRRGKRAPPGEPTPLPGTTPRYFPAFAFGTTVMSRSPIMFIGSRRSS